MYNFTLKNFVYLNLCIPILIVCVLSGSGNMSLPFDEKKFKNGKYHMSPNKSTVKYSCTLSSYLVEK